MANTHIGRSPIVDQFGRPFEKAVPAGGEVGFTGLNRFGGWVREDYLDKWVGPKKIDTVARMRADGMVQAILLALTKPIAAASWVVEPGGKDANAKRAADLVERNIFEKLG